MEDFLYFWRISYRFALQKKRNRRRSAMNMKIERALGSKVTPIEERKSDSKDDRKEVHHSFRKGEKLTIDRISECDNLLDGTKNYWCSNEEGEEQIMNEKEIISYEESTSRTK